MINQGMMKTAGRNICCSARAWHVIADVIACNVKLRRYAVSQQIVSIGQRLGFGNIHVKTADVLKLLT
jgi:hypothetical protein